MCCQKWVHIETRANGNKVTMSADDFQTKYSSVMESMLKSAVAETTKLFETMVDELKAEISQIKKENEDLKTRCSQFENARNQPAVYTRGNEPLQGRSDGSEKRDTAVQCDLVPLRTMLVGQSDLLRHSWQNQEQQCSYEAMECALQETHTEGSSEMAFVLKQKEEVEPTVVCGQVSSNKAGSPQASACGSENEETFSNQECSTGHRLLPQKDAETQMTPELEHSVVISLAAIKDDMEEESEVGQTISEIGTQEKLRTFEQHPLEFAEHQSEVEPLEKDQPSVVPQQCQREGNHSAATYVQPTEELLAQLTPHNKGGACSELKNGVTEGEASSLPALSVRRRRGRPPKKAKPQQRSVKEISQSPFSHIPAEKGVQNPPTVRVEKVEFSDSVGTVKVTSSKSPQASPVQPKESAERANTASEDVDNIKAGSVASLSRSCSSKKEITSESPQTSKEMEERAIQAPSIVSSANENTNNSPGMSVQPRERRTSVTLQDAMLLVEAMNQSNAEITPSSPQRIAAPPLTLCAPSVCTLETVDEVPSEPQTPSLTVETPETASRLPGTELSTTTQSTIGRLSAAPKTPEATPTSEALAHINVVTSKQQHMLPLSNITTSLSSVATQTIVQSLKRHPAHPPKTSVPPNRPGNAAPHKIIVVSRSASTLMSCKIVAQSPTQLSTVASKAVAAQNNGIFPGSTTTVVPLGNPISNVPQKSIYVTSRKSLPVVTSQLTGASTDPQSGTLPRPKITIIIPRPTSTVASRKPQPQTIVLTSKQESAQSSQLISSSQELSVSVDTLLSQMRVNASDNLESTKQTASVSETINAPTETCSNTSVGLVPTSMSPVVPPTSDQSAVFRLTRLTLPLSSKVSASVSKQHTNGYSESILKEDATHEKPSVGISTQPSETLAVSTDICPTLKETSVAVSLNTCHVPEEPNDIQEKASLSSENRTTLEEWPKSEYVQPSPPSKEAAPLFEKPTKAITRTEPSAVPGTAGELTSNLDKAIISTVVQQCALLNDTPTEEKQSAPVIHLTPITPKDISDPHLQMTKAQFLAKLAVSPVVQDPKKASSNDSVDAIASCAETSPSDRKKSLLAQLRSHLKTHFQARRTETNPEPCTEPCTETESHTVSPNKPRSENDSPHDENTSWEPIPVGPKNPGAVEDLTSPKETTNVPTPISPTTSGLCKDGVRPKRTVSEPTYVSSRRSKANSESTPLSPRRSSSGRDVMGSTNKKSTSVRARRSLSVEDSASPKKTKYSSVRPRRTSSTRDGARPKNTKTGGRPNNNSKTTSVRPKRTSSGRAEASPKTTQCTSVSPRTSSLSKNGTSSEMSTNESTTYSRRSCVLPKDDSSATQIKGESNSYSPRRCSITTDGASNKNSRSESSSLRWPKLAKDGLSPKKTGESTPAKKARLFQDGTSPKKNLRVVNAKKLAKAAKAQTIAKIKKSNQSKLQNGAKTRQLAENHVNCEAVRKCTAVWTPPRMSARKAPPAGGKRSSLKRETRSPRSGNHTVVYPPSVSLHPIPIKAPPIVSPLQPLSVIGRRLLKNQCGECGRVLSSSAALESHVSLHTGRRPFSCTLCGKRFPDSKGLKRHGRVHRNGRIHICQQCGKGFVYSFGLTKHQQMVHGRIKPFVCQICNKGFFTKRDVEAHIRIHTGEKPFHCNLCEKQFARRVELNVHLRWHNGEKRHWCPYCGKGFLDFNNLKRHKYIHTGEKPHSCPHCPKHFTQSGHLKKHVKNVHKIP